MTAPPAAAAQRSSSPRVTQRPETHQSSHPQEEPVHTTSATTSTVPAAVTAPAAAGTPQPDRPHPTTRERS